LQDWVEFDTLEVVKLVYERFTPPSTQKDDSSIEAAMSTKKTSPSRVEGGFTGLYEYRP
jgi:hypothetical protein